MQDDSFRGTCLKCGGRVGGGANIHKECAQPDSTPKPPYGGDAPGSQLGGFGQPPGRIVQEGNRTYYVDTYPPYSRTNNRTIARIPDTMANVQVCERCGSIGQAKDFVSLSAVTLGGSSLVFPGVVTHAQFAREHEESMEDEEPQSNFTICRNCKEDFKIFLENGSTQPRSAGPIAPKLPPQLPNG